MTLNMMSISKIPMISSMKLLRESRKIIMYLIIYRFLTQECTDSSNPTQRNHLCFGGELLMILYQRMRVPI